MNNSTIVGWLLATAFWFSTASAGVVLDQSVIGFHETPLAIGGSSEQMLAQTFVPGISGELSHLELVFSCSVDSVGLLTVAIERVDSDGQPNGDVLGSVSLDSSTLNMEPIFFREVIIPGVNLIAGEKYAIVMSADASASCASREGPCETCFFNYPSGEAFFDARPNPPGWVAFFPQGMDLPFYTYMRTAEPTAPRYCDFTDASGVPNDWLTNDLPICGCLSDPVLRSNRCWFALPDFMLWRELPLDLKRGPMYWQVLPLSSELPGIKAIELDRNPDPTFRSSAVKFDPQLEPGVVHETKGRFRGQTDATVVNLFIDHPQHGPMELTFETSLKAAKPDNR